MSWCSLESEVEIAETGGEATASTSLSANQGETQTVLPDAVRRCIRRRLSRMDEEGEAPLGSTSNDVSAVRSHEAEELRGHA